MKHSARALGELLYQLGKEHGAAQEILASKLGKELAKAFDDGFVLGRETGLKDAGFTEEGAPDSQTRPKLN